MYNGINMVLSINGAIDAIIEAITEGLGPIVNLRIEGSHIRDIIVQLSATILLFVIVRFFLWKPITNFLEKRREAIDENLDNAAKANENAKLLESQKEQEMIEAKKKIKELLDNAERDGNQRREEIINEAKLEAKRRHEALEKELELEKSLMSNEIKKEIVDIAFQAAEKIIAREIDQQKHLDIVEEIIKESL